MKKIQIILIAFCVIIGIIWFVGRITNGIQYFTSSSRANEPTFKKGGHYFGTNLKTPKRLDFICYNMVIPEFAGQIWVHRLCGLPGDTIEIRSGDLYVNGVNQDESLNLKKEYAIPVNLVAELDFEEGDARPIANTDSIIVPLETIRQKDLIEKAVPHLEWAVVGDPEIEKRYGQPWTRSFFGPYVVPADKYFVLGDNRYFSMDSRYSGPIDKKEYLTTVIR
jgi:signal peptidase I